MDKLVAFQVNARTGKDVEALVAAGRAAFGGGCFFSP